MTPERFEKVFEEQVKECSNLLAVRGDVYARYGDRLSNFKKVAELRSTTPEDALGGIMSKHVVALYDFIDQTVMVLASNEYTLKGTAASRGDTSPEQWKEKITDSINYLILLRALLEDTGRI